MRPGLHQILFLLAISCLIRQRTSRLAASALDCLFRRPNGQAAAIPDLQAWRSVVPRCKVQGARCEMPGIHRASLPGTQHSSSSTHRPFGAVGEVRSSLRWISPDAMAAGLDIRWPLSCVRRAGSGENGTQRDCKRATMRLGSPKADSQAAASRKGEPCVCERPDRHAA